MAAFYYRFGDNEVPSLDPMEDWSITFNPVTRPIGGVRAEALETAKALATQASNANQKVLLHLSGGDDSVAMIHSFLEIGCEFDVVTRVYKSQDVTMNEDDVLSAIKFAKLHDLELELDVYEDMDATWRTTEYTHLRDMTVMAANICSLRHQSHFNVLGGAPFIVGQNSSWGLLPTFNPTRGLRRSFFTATPELTYALLSHKAFDMVQPAINVLALLVEQATQVAGKQRLANVYLYEKIVKAIIMHEAWPELAENPRVKNTGLEKRPPGFNSTATPNNRRFIDLLWQKTRPIPLKDVREFFTASEPTKVVF